VNHTTTVFEALRQRRRLSRIELVELTGLSSATVSRAVARLRHAGMVSEYAAPSPYGRPPLVVELLPRSAFVIAVDAGGSQLRATLVDLQGDIVAAATRRIRRPSVGDAVLQDIARAISEVQEAAHGGHILAGAAGVSGIVDSSAGRVLLSPDLPGLNGMAVRERLEDDLSFPIAVDNDDLLAAAGEAAYGAARGCRDVVFLSLGYGLGAGILVGGRPVRGGSNAAGAIAYLGPPRLEDRASGRAIARRYLEERAAQLGNDVAALPAPALDARAVFELAASGADAAAARVAEDVAHALTELVIAVAALLNPEVIVLGGGLSSNRVQVVDPIMRDVARALPFPPRIAVTDLADRAVVQGAAVLALSLAKTQLATTGSDPPQQPIPARVGELELIS
jgi:predicted NBD/HSP70 family sugar kinase